MEKLKFNFTLGDDTELLKKMKEAYLACPAAVKYCKELGIPDEKIPRICRERSLAWSTRLCRQKGKRGMR